MNSKYAARRVDRETDTDSGAAPTGEPSRWSFTLLPEVASGQSRVGRPRSHPSSEIPAQSLQLLRINDVCQLLRISKPTLWRLRRDHRFPEPTDVTGRVVAWKRTEIQNWIAGRHRSATLQRNPT